MEFLKSLFEKGALTWEQFQQAAKDAKFEVVNAASGAYVPKADLDTKAQELTTANNTIKDLRAAAKAWDGKDPKKLEDDLKTLQTKYDTVPRIFVAMRRRPGLLTRAPSNAIRR